MNDEGWEARMAERTQARRLVRLAEEITMLAASGRNVYGGLCLCPEGPSFLWLNGITAPPRCAQCDEIACFP